MTGAPRTVVLRPHRQQPAEGVVFDFDGQCLEDFVMAQATRVRRLEAQVANLQDENRQLRSHVGDRLVAIAEVHRALTGARRGPVKLINRDSAGAIDSIEEFIPDSAP